MQLAWLKLRHADTLHANRRIFIIDVIDDVDESLQTFLRFNMNFSQLDLVKNISWVQGVHTIILHHDYSANLIKMICHKFRLFVNLSSETSGPASNVPPVYGLDVTDLTNWEATLLTPALEILDCLQKVWLVFFLVLLANNVSFTPHWSLVVLWTQPWRFCIIVCVAVSCQWFLVAFLMEFQVFLSFFFKRGDQQKWCFKWNVKCNK